MQPQMDTNGHRSEGFYTRFSRARIRSPDSESLSLAGRVRVVVEGGVGISTADVEGRVTPGRRWQIHSGRHGLNKVAGHNIRLVQIPSVTAARWYFSQNKILTPSTRYHRLTKTIAK